MPLSRLNRSEDGQTLIEFILLMLVLVMLSYTMLKGINYAVSERWKALVGIVANPTTTPIEL